MIPDYSIELCFNNDQRAVVQSRMAQLCDPEYSARIQASPFGDTKWDAEICIPGPTDVAADLLQDFRKLEDGTTSCGYIDFEYAPHTPYVSIPDCFAVELWPRTKRLQFIFFSSMEFRTTLISILERGGGACGSIVYESSFPIGFWSTERGRYNDDRPERSSNKLFVPSELEAG